MEMRWRVVCSLDLIESSFAAVSGHARDSAIGGVALTGYPANVEM